MKESQKSIAEWAEQAFGKVGSNARVVGRANEEMAELVRAATSGKPPEKLVEEAADVVIVLYRLAERCGFCLEAMIDYKMEVNRKREWKQDQTGCGYHTR